MANLAGIDYGSKLAGTTAIALDVNEETVVFQSAKKQNADAFILEILTDYSVELVGLDAPLSLPGVYHNLANCTDFHYRHADKELQAMSPMFLGGLTARAMALKRQLEAKGVRVIEVYPKAVATFLHLDMSRYKKDKDYLDHLPKALLGDNWHQVDAKLALNVSQRFVKKEANQAGLAKEGLIFY